MADTVQIEQQLPVDALDWPESAVLPPEALIHRIDGPFFFGAAEKLERTLERVQLNVHTIVSRFGRVPFIDATGLQALTELVGRFQKRKVRVIFCGLHDSVEDSLRRAGLLDRVGAANVCGNLSEVAARL